MFSVIYIEEAILDHPRVQAICERYKETQQIICRHYGEIFNRNKQNFRFQKKNPALILAHKQNKLVLPAPDEYSIGGGLNYYFSHMLNCIYDCRYCFLQGMYRSAFYVLFVNYEDFFSQINKTINEQPERQVYFFSGYDCDSLALEPVTGFADSFLPLFREHKNSVIELRTKSVQIRNLLRQPAFDQCVIAYSLSPDNIADTLELKAPGLDKRLKAISQLQQRGWNIGLRFDPVIYQTEFKAVYRQFFQKVFSTVDADQVHSVSLGTFRMPADFFQKMQKLYPQEKLFAAPLTKQQKQIAYHPDIDKALMTFCQQEILQYIPKKKYFPCQ